MGLQSRSSFIIPSSVTPREKANSGNKTVSVFEELRLFLSHVRFKEHGDDCESSDGISKVRDRGFQGDDGALKELINGIPRSSSTESMAGKIAIQVVAVDA
jgi:hypothetical protein